jgi:hypothetical protein
MTRTLAGLLIAAASGSITTSGLQAPAPQIQNGKVETRRAATIDREIAAAQPSPSGDPVWVAWRVPMIDGDRDMCSWYSDRLGTLRGMHLDEGSVFYTTSGVADGRPKITPPTGPVPLEAGTGLIALARVIGGKVERLRTVADDCPMDANGRTVLWLEGVTPAESIRYLSSLADAGAADRSPGGVGLQLVDIERRISESAVRAIGYHRDATADAALDRIATGHRDSGVRRQAASTLASLRGAAGVSSVSRLLAAARDADERRALTSALGQSRDPSVVAALRPLTGDPDARIRAEASYWLVQRGGSAVVPDALKIIAGDKDESVRRRTVSAIGRLPADSGIPHLLQLARTSTDAVVRKEAVTALGQSRDPRAVAFMEELIKR